jgi:hypothetical protein
MDDRGIVVRFPTTATYSLLQRILTGSEAHYVSIQLVTQIFSVEIMRPEREADHLPPSSVEDKKICGAYLHFIIRLHNELRDKFTFHWLFAKCRPQATDCVTQILVEQTDISYTAGVTCLRCDQRRFGGIFFLHLRIRP